MFGFLKPTAAMLPFSAPQQLFARHILGTINEDNLDSAIFLTYLFAASRCGHICIEIAQELKPAIGDVFENIENLDELSLQIRQGASKLRDQVPSIRFFGNKIYLQRNFVFETHIIRRLSEFSGAQPFAHFDLTALLNEIDTCEQLKKEQAAAARSVSQNCLTLICGGPGSGKTYLAARLVELFTRHSLRPCCKIIITAPTGRAADHLGSKVAGKNVKVATLHSLLMMRQHQNRALQRHFIDADLVIVDEASMIDIHIMAALLEAIAPGCRLVLIGDPNQLPPVEVGEVFGDLAECSHFPKVFLPGNLRANNLELIDLSEAIIAGDSDKALTKMQSIRKETIDLTHLAEYIHMASGCEFDEGQIGEILASQARACILSCLKEGPLGVFDTNRQLWQYACSQVKLGELYAIPIIITKNDYHNDLYNGLRGLALLRYDGKCHYGIGGVAYFYKGKLCKYVLNALQSYEPAFCLSVHKSQGSEFERVLLIAPNASELFGREILYTAVTRAKKQLEIIATKELLHKMIQKKTRKTSGISDRLQNNEAISYIS